MYHILCIAAVAASPRQAPRPPPLAPLRVISVRSAPTPTTDVEMGVVDDVTVDQNRIMRDYFYPRVQLMDVQSPRPLDYHDSPMLPGYLRTTPRHLRGHTTTPVRYTYDAHTQTEDDPVPEGQDDVQKLADALEESIKNVLPGMLQLELSRRGAYNAMVKILSATMKFLTSHNTIKRAMTDDENKISYEVEFSFVRKANHGVLLNYVFVIIVRALSEHGEVIPNHESLPEELQTSGVVIPMKSQKHFINRWSKFVMNLPKQPQDAVASRLPQAREFDRSKIWDVQGGARSPSLFLRFAAPFECNICQNSLIGENEDQPLTVLDCYLNRCSGCIYHEACLTHFLSQQTKTNADYFCPVCRHDCTATAQETLIFTTQGSSSRAAQPPPLVANQVVEHVPIVPADIEEIEGVEMNIPMGLILCCRGKIMFYTLIVTVLGALITWGIIMSVIAMN